MVLDFKINLSYYKTNNSEIPLINVVGDIDIHTSSKLNQHLTDLINQGNEALILDLSQVAFIDSMGLGSIAHVANNLSKLGGILHVVCTTPHVEKVFIVSGLKDKGIINISNTVESLFKNG